MLFSREILNRRRRRKKKKKNSDDDDDGGGDDGDDSSGAHFLKKIKKRARPLSPFIHHTLNSYVPFAGKVKKESSAAKKVGFFDERDERVQE